MRGPLLFASVLPATFRYWKKPLAHLPNLRLDVTVWPLRYRTRGGHRVVAEFLQRLGRRRYHARFFRFEKAHSHFGGRRWSAKREKRIFYTTAWEQQRRPQTFHASVSRGTPSYGAALFDNEAILCNIIANVWPICVSNYNSRRARRFSPDDVRRKRENKHGFRTRWTERKKKIPNDGRYPNWTASKNFTNKRRLQGLRGETTERIAAITAADSGESVRNFVTPGGRRTIGCA